MGGSGSWAGGSSVFTEHDKIQYEWRLVGELDAPASIEATIQLDVDGT